MSLAWGPDPVSTVIDRGVETATLTAGEAAGKSSLTSLSGTTTTSIASPLEKGTGVLAKGAGDAVLVFTAEATIGDVAVHFSCLNAQSPPSNPVNMPDDG